ncbi:PRI2 [Candida oxycetoniae]|uniref:DNA primase large subunit n=1 Tax=Candida oxycetoniae TaxID=497107 RepID=A0AAI9X015_9ASCO|nr:PRI2 [Candida oxycetoniae]KAI3406639.2 PRI2 [Candida oxycetoniae]
MFRQVKRKTAGRRNFEDKNNFSSSPSSSVIQYSLPKLFSSRLSFYDLPPTEEITLEEFEKWAIDRLKILIEIESCIARTKTPQDTELAIKPLLLKFMPLSSNGAAADEAVIIQERMKDYYSHFILRLVFCRSEDLRRKFIKNETILFRIRYNMLQPREQREFVELNSYKLPWSYISSKEKEELIDSLFAASGNILKQYYNLECGLALNNDQVKQRMIMKENFIKLPFEKLNQLVSNRSVYLHKGYGYLPTSLQLNLLAAEFSENLNQILIRTFQAIPRLEEDDRLIPLLNSLSKNFANFQYDSEENSEFTSDINAITITSKKIMSHYPLCATHLQRGLMTTSHLRYNGRQQLGIFLKGIGLNVDEALKFWSQQFTKNGKLTLDSFNKEYKYNIRHQYGLEGARINYRPWDCATILSKPKPSSKEFHGCPYRDFSLQQLKQALDERGITNQQDINSIMDNVENHEYTIACTRVFELSHQRELIALNKPGQSIQQEHINHPNLYFDRSRKLERDMQKKEEVMTEGSTQR